MSAPAINNSPKNLKASTTRTRNKSIFMKFFTVKILAHTWNPVRWAVAGSFYLKIGLSDNNDVLEVDGGSPIATAHRTGFQTLL